MKFVIQTQFRENYGAHDWDGVGECPQYWKSKGGDTYFIDVNVEEVMDSSFYTSVLKCIEHKSDYSQEFVIYSELVDDIDFKESDHCDEWESPIYCIKLSDRDELMCKQLARRYDLDSSPYGERSWSQTPNGRDSMRLITFEQMERVAAY